MLLAVDKDDTPAEKISEIETQLGGKIKELVETSTPLVSAGQILVSTLIFGPMSGMYFLWYSFSQLNNKKAARKSIYYAISFICALFSIFLFSVFAFGVDADVELDINTTLIMLLIYGAIGISYVISIIVVFYKHLEDKTEAWFQSGAAKYSWWKLLGISFLILILTSLFVEFINNLALTTILIFIL